MLKIPFLSLCSPGDNIIAPNPSYWFWIYNCPKYQVEPRFYSPKSREWELDPNDIEKLIDSKTKFIVSVSPGNPNSVVYSKELLEKIALIAEKHSLVIVSDEIYHEAYHPDVGGCSMSEINPDIKTPILIMSGLAKNACTPGFLTEWLICRDPKNRLKSFKKRMSQMAASFNLQSAVLIKLLPLLLKAGTRMTEERMKICQENWKIIENELWDQDEIRLCRTTAGFYATIEVTPESFPTKDEFEFAYRLLHTKSVKLFPGRVLGAPNLLRLSLLVKKEDVRTGVKRIKEFLVEESA